MTRLRKAARCPYQERRPTYAAGAPLESHAVLGRSRCGFLSVDKWNYSVAMPAPAVPNDAGISVDSSHDTNANGRDYRRDAAAKPQQMCCAKAAGFYLAGSWTLRRA
ncbi:hypothetical protein StoSoilB5_32700 [Arthrobacter sp. StoSoilB5]|nr:hypothetical protein StoSoilB5_32700 [Arthrobacter sp. StoSoilB5]